MEENTSRELVVDVRIILKWLLKKLDIRVWIGIIYLRMGPVTGCFDHVNKRSGSEKAGNCFIN